MSFKFGRKTSLLLLSFLALFTRFIGLFWGNGYFFHPDENNMGLSIANMGQDLNPHFFAYGQFPLYLAYFTIKALSLNQNMATAIYILRLYSSLFSLLTIITLTKIGQFFFTNKQNLIFTILVIFSPGLIQLAHFGTTESLLIFIFCLQIYLGLIFLRRPNTKIYLLSILISSIGLSTKISSVFLMAPFLLSILFTSKKISAFLLTLTIYFTFLLPLSLLLSPHSLINWSDFTSAQSYEASVAIGTLKVFYTRQFDQTIPYLFQLSKVFPFAIGLPIFVLALFFLPKLPKYINLKNHQKFLIILLPCLVYFLYFGQLYVKWTRFMSPLFFLFPFLATFILTKLSSKLNISLIALSIIPAIVMLSIYIKPDIRLNFSTWINQNIQAQTIILSEAGNVINIPLYGDYQTTNFDFYNLDQDPSLQAKLPELISQTDYIIIPSRRILKNQNNPNYPHSQNYYQNLFNHNFGFKHLQTFSTPLFGLIDEMAEETWSVFDHPVIRLYEKQI